MVRSILLFLGLAHPAGVPPRAAPAPPRGTVEATAPDQVRFRHLTIADGLSQNAVQAITQDARGFLWFGTKDGLDRYDGYGFEVFRDDLADSTAISDKDVRALFQDSRGNLWIGTARGGIDRFDRDTNAFQRYPDGPSGPITSFGEDSGGDVWIGTRGDGLYRMLPEDSAGAGRRFQRFEHDPTDGASLSSDTVFAVLLDHQGTLWVGTDAGLDRLEPKPDGRFAFHHYGADSRASDGLLGRTVRALYEDAEGRLWVGSPYAIDVLDSLRQHVSHYTSPPGGPAWGGGRSFAEDPEGRMWIVATHMLLRFDPRTRAFETFRHDPLDPQSISGGEASVLFRDRSNVLWVGTNGLGIDVHDTKAERFHTFRGPTTRPYRYGGFSIHMVFEDSRGGVWIQADRLYRWNRETQRLQTFEPDPDPPDAFGSPATHAMAEAPKGILWVGTSRGLYRYDLRNGAVRHWAHDPTTSEGLPETEVRDVRVARDGSIWVATENFLAHLTDERTGRFHAYRYTDTSIHGTWPLRSLNEDPAGVFWLGSTQGLVRVDPATGSVRHYRHDAADTTSIGDDAVRAILPDPREPGKTLWIGTGGGGLNRFDIATGTFRRYTVRDGLPNNVVVGVLADDDGDLWLSTNHGICRFDPENGTVRSYDARDGLQSDEFNLNASFGGADGELYFGGLYGLTYFRPEDVRDNPHVPPVVITRLHLGEHRESVRDTGTILNEVAPETGDLRLSYRNDVVTLEFAALDFSNPARNRYAYRMSGLSDRWIDAGGTRTATYTNLPPGSYTFQVRASNNDGVWNEDGVSLPITVMPPWWRASWAYALYGLMTLAVLYWIRRREMQRLRLKAHLEVQRLEADHLRELDRARSRFFANVSHEFRTPLTLTMGPLDDLRAGLHGPLPPEVVEQVDMARRNAGRVLELIEQVLAVARLETGEMRLHARRLDIGAVVRSVTRSLEPLAERATVSLRVRTPAEAVEVYADVGQLERILSNLLSNAIKFTPSGGHVRVSVDADPESARVAVRDSGPGIPAAELTRVFERFHRADTPATRSQPGTGIGLALAKELAELHGGSVEVESEEGFGSTFTLILRRGRAHLSQDQIVDDDDTLWRPSDDAPTPGVDVDVDVGAPALDDGPAPAEPGGETGDEEEPEDVTTVLVVEDNAEVRAYITKHLARRYRVLEASDGQRGLEMARRLLPDLVLSDVMMEGLDGNALCRALKQDPETDFVPVILLTARAAPEDRIAGLHDQADDYLTKPFDVDELLARIENLIGLRERLRLRIPVSGVALHAEPVEVESADDRFLQQVRAAIEESLADETFTVARLAEDVHQSRGHLHRRLRDLLDESPSDLIRRIRLERAAQLLEAGAGSVSSIAYAVGFKSVAHFSNSFQGRFGVRPSAYRAPE